MRIVKILAFMCAIFITTDVFSSVLLCYTKTDPRSGYSAKLCMYLFMADDCDNKQLLNFAGNNYPQGWMCHNIRTNSGTNDLQLVSETGGNTYVYESDQEMQIVSDTATEFAEQILREGSNMRMSNQAKKDRMSALLAADDGSVSDVRLKQLSKDLGVPIQEERSLNPKEKPGKGKGRPSVDH